MVPLNFFLFARIFLQNRLPTKKNLLSCDIIDSSSILCVEGCGLDKSSIHLLFDCPIFELKLCLLLGWLGIQWTFSNVAIVYAQEY